MKAYVRPALTKKERQIVSTNYTRDLHRATTRAQWLWIVALNEIFGFGEERILRILEALTQITDEYSEYRTADVGDELLERRVRQIMPASFKRLYDD